MSAVPRLSLDVLNSADKTLFVSTLGGIFEHSPWVAEVVFDQRPFATLRALHESMKSAVARLDDVHKLVLLNAHPDLAGKAARAGTVTTDSKLEQSDAGLDRLSAAEFVKFHFLNSTYKKKFGFPFIICVRRHTKDSIFHQFDARLKNDFATEYNSALVEIFRITVLRLDQQVFAQDKLNVHGRLGVHVIDMQRGRPAAGLGLELRELSAQGAQILRNAVTDAFGQSDAPLIESRPIPIGNYELRIALADYFVRDGTTQEDVFLDVVPVRFSVAEAEGDYHICLRVTPWSYTVYRGQ